LSPGRLTHLFTEQVGMPIKQYVVWLRMLAVLEQFSSSEQLSALAHGQGFADQAAFTRAYREMWGRTPTSFRRTARIVSAGSPNDEIAARIKRR
jgi:AraC-like DNA-binding protein